MEIANLNFSEMQIEYLRNATHRWNVKCGATGSGKSFLDFFMIAKRIAECTGQGLIVLIGNTRSTLNRNILEPMRSIYNDENHVEIGSIRADGTCQMFGKKVFCFGADKVNSVAKIQGATIEYAYGDEVTTWSQEVFEMLKSRLRCENSCFDGTCNPDSPNHWFKAFLDSDADIYQQHYTIDDNPFLPVEFVENLKKEYAGSVYYKRFIEGLWAIAEGLVYAMFDSSRNMFAGAVPYNPYSTYYLAIDYGTMNPFAIGLMEFTEEGKVRMIAEDSYSGRETGTTVDNEIYYQMIERIAEGYEIAGIVIDPSAAGMKATIHKYGRFKTIDGNNDVISGIQEVTKYLNAGFLQIHESCSRAKKEFESYSWSDKPTADGKDQVIKENDHIMDLIRYFIYTIARKYNKGNI